MSVLRGRYAGNPESTFDFDIRQIASRGVAAYGNAVIDAELSSSYWETLLPQEMETSSSSSPYFLVYQAAQVKLGDLGFLSRAASSIGPQPSSNGPDTRRPISSPLIRCSTRWISAR